MTSIFDATNFALFDLLFIQEFSIVNIQIITNLYGAYYLEDPPGAFPLI